MTGGAPAGTTITRSSAETAALGKQLARRLCGGSVVALYGNLGSGKTCFSQGVGQGLGVSVPMTSPTFTLINEYLGHVPVYHIDLYRLQDSRDLAGLGLDEYVYGDGVCLVEWAERGEAFLPPERWNVYFELVPAQPQWRRIRISRR